MTQPLTKEDNQNHSIEQNIDIDLN
jgi:hypothetical protein